MIQKIKDFIRVYFNDIILFIIVVLLVMLPFAAGYISAKYQTKSPIIIENTQK
jgi:hypothetical protein